jgi:three-Cys-motif partner protein
MERRVMNAFGGPWTQTKLVVLDKYLRAFRTLMRSQPFQTIYVDGFAGTGGSSTTADEDLTRLFDDEEATDARRLLAGSVRLAVDLESPFDRYLFVEKHRESVLSLEAVVAEYPGIKDRISILRGDANRLLTDWCNEQSWRDQRAVVFLDPYGMQVDWELLQAIASTGSIDLWLLFPSGIGVNRMLTARGVMSKQWEARLDRFFGEEEWRTRFYTTHEQPSLFNDEVHTIKGKVASPRSIAEYFVERLGAIFPKVLPNPLPLLNTTGTTLFHLYFACANPSPRAHLLATRIARDIIRKESQGGLR